MTGRQDRASGQKKLHTRYPTCAESACLEMVVDGLYSHCFGCGFQFCDAHLLYCTTHEDQHCEECCDNEIAPLRRPKQIKPGVYVARGEA